MSMLILCAGRSLRALEGPYDSAGFDSAVSAERDAGIEPYTGRKTDSAQRTVYAAEGKGAQETAGQLLLPSSFFTEPLLNEIPLRSFTDTDKCFPVEKWKRKAAAQRKAGDPRQPESRAEVTARAEALIEKLECAGGDSLLISYPLFLAEFLDRLRTHGYVIQRSGLLKIEPLERIVASKREEHCGGCGHNCFLANPGCGVGRDKAMRQRR